MKCKLPINLLSIKKYFVTCSGINSFSFQYVVFILSILSTGGAVFFGRYDYPIGADHFTEWANYIVYGGRAKEEWSSRDIGYPLLLVISGYPFSYSFLGITLINSIFGILIPNIIYKIFVDRSPLLGLISACAIILSGTSIVFIKFIHHDCLYLFVSVLVIYFYSQLLNTKNTKFIYFSLFSSLFLSVTRPVGNAIIIILFLFIFIASKNKIRHLILCSLISVFIIAFYHNYRVSIGLDRPEISYSGRQIFYAPYVNSIDYVERISPEMGPAVSRLMKTFEAEITKSPPTQVNQRFLDWISFSGFPESVAYDYFYKWSVDELIQRVWLRPNYDYFELLCYYVQDDDLFKKAAFEIILSRPIYVIHYLLKNLNLFYISTGYVHPRFAPQITGMTQTQLWFALIDGGGSNLHTIPLPGSIEVQNLGLDANNIDLSNTKIRNYFFNTFVPIFEYISIITFTFTIVGIFGIYFMDKESRLIFYFSGAMLFYNGLISCLFADPYSRYHYSVMPEQVICGVLGMVSILNSIKYFFTIYSTRQKNPRNSL